MPVMAKSLKIALIKAGLASALLAVLVFASLGLAQNQGHGSQAQQPSPVQNMDMSRGQSMPGMDMSKPSQPQAPQAQAMPGMDMSSPSANQSMPGMDMTATPAPKQPAQAMPGMDMSKPAQPQAQSMPGMDMSQGAQASEAMPPMAMLTPEQARIIGVSVATVQPQAFKTVVRATGRVAADETRLATVTTKTDGYVERLMVDHVGQLVRKGQPLLEIYSPEVYAVELEYLSQLRWRQSGPKPSGTGPGAFSGLIDSDSQALLGAARQRLALLDAGGLAAGLEKSGRPSRTFALVSPVNGYVISRQATLGMGIKPGDKLYDLADLSTVWVLADVYEQDLPFVREGQQGAITLTGLSGQAYMAKVDQIYPVISGDTRTARLRFVLLNPKGLLKPDMYADIRLESDLGQHLAVPDSAVMDTGLRKVVYQETSPNTFEPREVRTGIRAGGFVEIASGLAQGDKVATSANFLLDAETRLQTSGGGSMAGMDMGDTKKK